MPRSWARPDAVGLVGHRAGVDPEESRQDVGRIGGPPADAVHQPHLVADDPPESVGEPRPAAEDVVEHHQGVVVGMIARDPQMPENDLNLLSRLIDPPDPRPKKSWATLILPYVELDNLGGQGIVTAQQKIIDLFMCNSDPRRTNASRAA